MKRREYQLLLEQIILSSAKQQGDFVKTAELATELLFRACDLSQASVFAFDATLSSQYRLAHFGGELNTANLNRPSALASLPRYLHELGVRRQIDAGRCLHDPRLAELANTYFIPAGIAACLDVPIRINGRLEGVLCLERSRQAPWSEMEICLATQVADQLALTLATSLSHEREEKLSLFKSAVEQSMQVSMLINLHTEEVEYVNRAHGLITRVPREKVMGRTLRELDFFKQHPELAEHVLGQILRGQSAKGEVCLSRYDGSEYWINYHASQFVTERGNYYVLVTCEDCTEQHNYQSELERLAWRCNLTGLFNRLYFNRLLDKTRKGQLLLVDLLGFKRFNDTYGHEQGDLLLIELARRLRHFSSLQDKTVIARVGSDEFGILLTGERSLKDVEFMASRLFQQLALPVPIGRDQLEPKLALAIVDIEAVVGLVSPLTCADIALQLAKQKSGVSIQVFNSALLSAFKEDAQIERDLHSAIRMRQFELYYQPLRDLQRDEYTGAEALIRWHHPQKGILYPGAFIDIAEQSGIITAIGSWVLEAACRQLNLWQHHNLAISMHVNVSARQFFSGNLYEQVWQLLTRYRLKPGSLILEITETELMEDIRYATNLCQELSELGVSFAIDDFGTGYSSMRYLKQFPISKLKIDRSFISDLTVSKESREIVAAIIAMAKALNLSLTAEGVETREQEAFLAANQCHQAQGFLYSPALREAEFSRFIGSMEHKPVLA